MHLPAGLAIHESDDSNGSVSTPGLVGRIIGPRNRTGAFALMDVPLR